MTPQMAWRNRANLLLSNLLLFLSICTIVRSVSFPSSFMSIPFAELVAKSPTASPYVGRQRNSPTTFTSTSPSAAPTSNGRRVLILIDPFSDYLSGNCRKYAEEQDIDLVECVSTYMCKFMESQGNPVPPSLRAPEEGQELEWAKEREEIFSPQHDLVYVLSESDSGVPTAERIQVALGLRHGNGITESLRNKFLSNQKAKECGLKVVDQVLARTWSDVEAFLSVHWKQLDSGEQKPKNDEEGSNHSQQNENAAKIENSVRSVVLKPYRGVASDGVFLARNLEEAKVAFNSIIGRPKYGGGVNDAVLVQEFADGDEYAVDTVSMDGDIKIVALWKYQKFAANGAPFVYQCSELVDPNPTADESKGGADKEEIERLRAERAAVCDYCVEVLKAQNLKWGPTHTEIKSTSNGPRLIEINARWHAQNFPPIVQRCLGYDAVNASLDSVFNPSSFSKIPYRPTPLKAAGLILHLVSYKSGTVKKINYLDDIANLPSVVLIDMDTAVGEEIRETVDIRTDSGYILLCHEDANIVKKDYDYICSLQRTMIEVEEENESSDTLNTLSEDSAIFKVQRGGGIGGSDAGAAGRKDTEQKKGVPKRKITRKIRTSSSRTKKTNISGVSSAKRTDVKATIEVQDKGKTHKKKLQRKVYSKSHRGKITSPNKDIRDIQDVPSPSATAKRATEQKTVLPTTAAAAASNTNKIRRTHSKVDKTERQPPLMPRVSFTSTETRKSIVSKQKQGENKSEDHINVATSSFESEVVFTTSSTSEMASTPSSTSLPQKEHEGDKVPLATPISDSETLLPPRDYNNPPTSALPYESFVEPSPFQNDMDAQYASPLESAPMYPSQGDNSAYDLYDSYNDENANTDDYYTSDFNAMESLKSYTQAKMQGSPYLLLLIQPLKRLTKLTLQSAAISAALALIGAAGAIMWTKTYEEAIVALANKIPPGMEEGFRG